MLAEKARTTPSPEAAVAVMRLQALTRQIVAFWSDVDVVVTPTLALPPVAVGWTWDGADGDPQVAFSRQWQWTPFTAIVNVTGQPAMSVPLHWSDDGLPIGVQMIGAPFAEATLIRARRAARGRAAVGAPAPGGLAHRVRELGGERPRVLLVARDHETRVVAGERADDALVRGLVDRARDRRRGAELGVHDDEVLREAVRRPNCVSTATSASCGSGRRRATGPAARSGAPESVVDLLEPELADVARDRRLRDPAARGGERLRHLELRPDPLATIPRSSRWRSAFPRACMPRA